MTLELVDRAAETRPPVEAPDGEGPSSRVARIATTLIVGIPFLGLLYAIFHFWGHGVGMRDLVLAVTLYLLTGHGVTIGFHRLLAHKSFQARRPLKIVLVSLGSMAYEGGAIEWVANHRRHHVFADVPGDPHSPQLHGRSTVKGLWHAHMGWLFTPPDPAARKDITDLLADRDIVRINSLFPIWCVVSMALPFGLGWALGGNFTSALSALLWAGLVRVCVLHHITWSVNSLCHMFGRRPFTTSDRSTNLRALSLISMGESWHNGHHAFPRSARHGLLRGQWDTSALIIRGFERLGWATNVHWPTPEGLRSRRGTSQANGRPPAIYRRNPR